MKNTMKRAIAAAMSAFMVAGSALGNGMVVNAASIQNDNSGTFADSFADASDRDSSVWTRWIVMGTGIMTEETISTELKAIADAGIKHVEVNNFEFLWTQKNAQTGVNYMDVFYWMLKYAKEYGVILDWSSGNMYPAMFDTDSQYYNKSLGMYQMSYHEADVNGTLSEEPLVYIKSSGGNWWMLGPGASASTEPETNLDDFEKICYVTAAYCDADNHILHTATLADLSKVEAGEDHTATVKVGEGSISLIDREGQMLDADGNVTTGYDGDFEEGSISVTDADLTSLLPADEQAAIANEEGTWKVFSFYKNEQSSYIKYIDYLNPDSTVAWANYWDNDILGNSYWQEERNMTKEEATELFESVSGYLFEDSLESFTINYADTLFTDEFEEVNGYEFPVDKLPTLIVGGAIGCVLKLNNDADYVYDSESDRQLRNDYYNAMTEMYNVNHLKVYTDWAESHGMGTKIQASYNYTLDQDSAMNYLTVAENETLNAQDQLDVYRTWTGSAHAHDINIISSESGANGDGKSYTCTWDDWMWHFNTQFAGGVNNSVLHVVDYCYGGWGTTWPGRSGAGETAGQCESMGQRMPYFELLDDTLTSYIAREQYVLQEGSADMDVAIYYYAYDYGLAGDSGRVWFTDQGMTEAGYAYDFLGDDSLQKATYDAEQGVLFPNGATYKALVINQNRPTNTGVDTYGTGMMPLATAKRILELAKEGLPVVIIGDAPDKSAENRDNYVDGVYQSATYGDEQVQAVMAELMALPNVTATADEASLPSALEARGITADAAIDASSNTEDLLMYHRNDGNVDYYFAFNQSYTSVYGGEERQISTAAVAHDISTDVTFKGPENGVPYLLDCWTGKVTRIADYTKNADGTYTIHLDLKANETTMIAIGTEDWYTDGKSVSASITDTTADSAAYDENGNLYVTAKEAGNYVVSDENGKEFSVTVNAVPSEASISDWAMTFKEYHPNEAFQSGDAGENNVNVYDIVREIKTNDDGTVKVYDPVDASTGKLLAWKDMADDLNTSGVGYYTATIHVPEDYDAATMGYTLNFDKVTEVFTVTINGKQVTGMNQFYESGDISEYLVPGDNTLEISVASGLFNSVQKYDTLESAAKTDVFCRDTLANWWSPDGIIGEVTLTGYGKAAVESPYTSIDAEKAAAEAAYKAAKEEAETKAAEAAAAKEAAAAAKAKAAEAKAAAEAAKKDAEATAAEVAAAKAEAAAAAEEAKTAKAEAAAAAEAAKEAEAAAEAAKAELAAVKAEIAKEQFKDNTIRVSVKRGTKTRTVKVTWSKVKGADGYTVKYSQKASMKGAVKATVKAASKTLKGLKKGARVYVKVRAYKLINGEKVYTGYTAAKSVKVK